MTLDPSLSAIATWLQHLRSVTPPRGVMLVGVGAGTGSWVELLADWTRIAVTLIEGDEKLFRHAVRRREMQPDWCFRNDVVAAKAGTVSFFEAANPSESGLLRPENLGALWPNAKTRVEHERQAVTLAELFDENEESANWLLIDCLPALPILQGGLPCLERVDLVAARVVLGNDVLAGGEASQGEVEAFLKAQGFRHLITETGRHPLVGHALYLRDYAAGLGELKKALVAAQASKAELAKELSHSQSCAALLSTEKAELEHWGKQQATLADERAAQLVQASEAQAAADRLAADYQQTIRQLAQRRDKQAKVIEDLGLKLEEAERERDDAEKRAADAQSLLTSFTESLSRATAAEQQPVLPGPHWLQMLVDQVMSSADLHEAADEIVTTQGLAARECFMFFVGLSERFQSDKTTALHFLNVARDHEAAADAGLKADLVQKYLNLERVDLAFDMFIDAALAKGAALPLPPLARQILLAAYLAKRAKEQDQQAHGHGLLLAHLTQNPQLIRAVAAKKRVLIEIGTTRENVPAQGSTRIIAEFCKQHGLHFITVDMDPHNSRMAEAIFSQLDVRFEAVTMKGEDYLRNHSGGFDFVFLDAYDFDHGKHSELRQSRYRKFLGSSIDDAACHEMHLDCAKSVAAKLAPDGVVCIDDTWLERGQWTAKGTLAMPYLLSNGFSLVAARNHAALLSRTPVSTAPNTAKEN